MTPSQLVLSFIAEHEHTKAVDVHENHLKASAAAGNLTAALDLLVLRNNRERLGDEAAAETVASAIEASA